MPVRLPPIVVVVFVAAIFIAGLFVHGIAGGILLVLTDAILLGLTYQSNNRPTQRGLALRWIVVALIAVLAVVKFAGKA